ncbi:sodium-dependent nutrient amino acid transporter 1-like [Ischnura elegans]|uniref:sodium-dependent nutrient amino acid transporter 1-like n=1 Tax=Ischnura elegans TaxID=197161 RepID=UPI001ED88454|nr:sodium-dependent nutrient amino acid transporter 1-like [Ischnura elegans]
MPVNEAFDHNSEKLHDADKHQLPANGFKTEEAAKNVPHEPAEKHGERPKWDKPIEFLLSCIAMSVGLGNLWRFPVTAFENGGGAFLIPYIIVLLVIGKPIYMMEMAMGQFFSSGTVRIWEMVPAFRGVGYAMMISVVSMVTYYCSLMALSIFYLISSFASELPWNRCDASWNDCFDSQIQDEADLNFDNSSDLLRSSSEVYFHDLVIHEKDNIDDGIGYPEWRLTLCLIFCWLCIFLVLIKGVKSSGKAAYFTAIFPYIVLITLLIKGATLPGADNGIIFFIKPHWEELLNPNVWMAAVTQCFFSLSVSFGPIIYYSSFNNFRHNFYRDVLVVTSMDTFTSLLAGFTIFSILGNLAHELGVEDVGEVVKGGTGLAFVSYPDALSKFGVAPQVFSVLFFVMLFTLGLGSAVSLIGSVITIYSDMMPKIPGWIINLACCIVCCILGLVYITPGGQFILTLVDYHGSSFVVYILSTFEVIGVMWVYGMGNFCEDIEFILGFKVNAYWRICWAILIPVFLPVVLIYSFVNYKPLTYTGISYPTSAVVCGWLLTAVGVSQMPIWAIIEYKKAKGTTPYEKLSTLFQPSQKWGPRNPKIKEEWKQFKATCMEKKNKTGRLNYMWKTLLGIEDCNFNRHKI